MEEITVDELRDLYVNHTVEYAADKVGVSIKTLLKYVDKAGIPRKGVKGGSKPKVNIIGISEGK